MQHLDRFGQRVLLARERAHEPSAPNRATVFEPPQRERDLAPRDVRGFDTEHLAREDPVTLEQLKRKVPRFVSTNGGSFSCADERPAAREARLQPRANRGIVTSRWTACDRLERALGAAIV